MESITLIDPGGSITYSDNFLRGTNGCYQGVLLERAAQVTGNKIDGCFDGIAISANSVYAVSIKTNLIVKQHCGNDSRDGPENNQCSVHLQLFLAPSPGFLSRNRFDSVLRELARSL